MKPSGVGSGRAFGGGLLLVFVTATVSGISTFVNLYAVQGTSSDAFVTVRNLLVALVFVPVAVLGARGPRAPVGRNGWLRLVTIGVVGGGIPFLLFFHGLQLATASGGGLTASFLYRMLFLMATILGVVFLAERLRWHSVLAAGLLIGGNLLLLALSSPVWTDGSLYILAATSLWAIEYTISKRTLRDLPSGTVALGRMGFGVMFLLGYLGFTGQFGAVRALSGAEWLWVGVSAALLAAFVGSWYSGLARVDLGVATSILVLGFPITWALTVAFRGSPATVPEEIGAITIAAGVALAVGARSFRETGRWLLRAPSPVLSAP